MRRLAIVLALSFGLLACKASPEPAAATSSGDELDAMDDLDAEPVVQHRGSAIEALGITPPERPWAEMNHQDREMYMVGKVLPIMNELFQRQNPTRYPGAGITCETCHGPDGEAHGFVMPSGHLMPLPPYGSPASNALAQSMPDSIRFMRETVTPTMGTLLGIDGYRCSHCHTSTP